MHMQSSAEVQEPQALSGYSPPPSFFNFFFEMICTGAKIMTHYFMVIVPERSDD